MSELCQNYPAFVVRGLRVFEPRVWRESDPGTDKGKQRYLCYGSLHNPFGSSMPKYPSFINISETVKCWMQHIYIFFPVVQCQYIFFCWYFGNCKYIYIYIYIYYMCVLQWYIYIWTERSGTVPWPLPENVLSAPWPLPENVRNAPWTLSENVRNAPFTIARECPQRSVTIAREWPERSVECSKRADIGFLMVRSINVARRFRCCTNDGTFLPCECAVWVGESKEKILYLVSDVYIYLYRVSHLRLDSRLSPKLLEIKI